MHAVVLLLNRGRGSGGVARQHARSLIERGHRVTFMHSGMDEGVAGADNRDVALHTDLLPVHEYLPGAGERQQPVATMTPAQALRYTADIVAALSAVEDADVVIGHHANLSAIAAHFHARRRKIPYVVFAHGTGIEPRHRGGYAEPIWKQIQSALEDADGIIVTTEYVRDELVRPLADIPLGRFFVLPCGVDLDEFHPDRGGDVAARYGLPDWYVVCPGALTELKGPQNVVVASREYADLAPTIFLGDGDLRHRLEGEIGDRGRFLGFVSDADKAALINSATVLAAAPEKREHFGIIYIEALAAGTVPVAYEGGGVDSIITCDTGIRTERNPAALGRAVRALLLDDDRRARMARAGRRRAEREYDRQELGLAFESWLSDLATAPQRPGNAAHPVYGRAAG